MSSPETDSILLPFLLASDEAEANGLLADLLVNRAAPVIKAIVRSSIGGPSGPEIRNRTAESQDIEDVVSEILLRLLDKLRSLKNLANTRSIGNFMGYVAVASHHACHAYLRLKYPNRTRLGMELRYLLTHRPEFALWKELDGEWYCGLAHWQSRREAVRPGWVNQTRMNPRGFINYEEPGDLTELLRATFDGAQAPLAMHDVITLAAELLKVSDAPVSFAEYLRSNHESLVVDFVDPLDTTIQQIVLERVWKEIVRLPLRQRISLLLGVKDETGTSIAVLLAEIRIASIQEIGDAVGMKIGEFTRLLPKLPLNDIEIGDRLDATSQQIESIRLSGRRRLTRKVESAKNERTRERAPDRKRNSGLSRKNRNTRTIRRHQQSHPRM